MEFVLSVPDSSFEPSDPCAVVSTLRTSLQLNSMIENNLRLKLWFPVGSTKLTLTQQASRSRGSRITATVMQAAQSCFSRSGYSGCPAQAPRSWQPPVITISTLIGIVADGFCWIYISRDSALLRDSWHIILKFCCSLFLLLSRRTTVKYHMAQTISKED